MSVQRPRAKLQAALLYTLVGMGQAAVGFYSAVGAEGPPVFVTLYPLALLWAGGAWLRADGRARGVKWVLDMGLFLYIAWPFFMPYYLFKTRRARGLLVALAFVVFFAAASVAGAALGVILEG
jgi:hypothetical protein